MSRNWDYLERRRIAAERSDAMGSALYRGVIAFCALCFALVQGWVYGHSHMGVWWFFFAVFVAYLIGFGRAVYRYLMAGD